VLGKAYPTFACLPRYARAVPRSLDPPWVPLVGLTASSKNGLPMSLRFTRPRARLYNRFARGSGIADVQLVAKTGFRALSLGLPARSRARVGLDDRPK